MVQAHVVFDLVGTALVVAILSSVCCMLLKRATGQAPKRLPPATIPITYRPHPRSLLGLAARPQTSQPSIEDASLISPETMLRGAVIEHEKKASRPHTFSIPGSNAPPTSPPANPAYRNPLAPSSASTLNGLDKRSQRPNSGIKRTSSGVAKIACGRFEEDNFGSQERPIFVGGRTPAKKDAGKALATDVFFDENDFDSDIDLEIEEPLPHQPIKYPKLPKSTPVKGSALSTRLHPTIPRQRQAQITFDEDVQISPVHELAGSSAPLPWSSSPVEHHTAQTKSLQNYAFKPRTTEIPKHDMTQIPLAKKRTIPWLEKQAEDKVIHTPLPATHSTSLPAAMKRAAPTATPSAKAAASSKYLWNTTASAVKQQQKKHREEARKSVKKIEGTEETVRAAKSNQKRPARVFLSEEQQHVLALVEDKKSVFFTGSAGTGKSVLLREIISTLRHKYQREPDRVATTASTGLAACNVGGITLHSFSGIGLGKEDVPELVRKIKRNQKAKHRWMRTKVLIIDEVSMVDGELFDKLEAIARQIRNNARPFGGIQLVITGDFFQLPPVPEHNRVAKFAFDAATWRTSIEYTIGLHQVFRQKDPKFAGMLNEMREGRLTEASISEFKKLSRPLPMEDQLVATELFPTRNEVDRANNERLALLQGKEFFFNARDGGSIVDKTHRDKLLSNCMAPETIILKKGAQVMLIKNIDESLVNGSIGRVIAFMDERQFDSYSLANDTENFPQSPGGTVQTSGGSNNGLSAKELMMDHVTTSSAWPLVRFVIADGTHRDLLCQAEAWKVELPTGEVQASRNQVPLILAWALSIHKAQGQTLDRVKVDLGKVFEKGQAYVALSRATRMEGLQVLRFDPKKVNAHDRVRAFYSNLSRVELAEKNKDLQEKKKQKPGMDALDYEAQFLDADFQDWGNDI